MDSKTTGAAEAGFDIKPEPLEYDEQQQQQQHDCDNEAELIECLESNKVINQRINQYLSRVQENKDKKNLLEYCGISDQDSESSETCARSCSIYAKKFGENHIRKSKIVNPYGAISQFYQSELKKLTGKSTSTSTSISISTETEIEKAIDKQN